MINKPKYNQIGEHVNLHQSSETCQQGEEKRKCKNQIALFGKAWNNCSFASTIILSMVQNELHSRACISGSLASRALSLDFLNKSKGVLYSCFWALNVCIMCFLSFFTFFGSANTQLMVLDWRHLYFEQVPHPLKMLVLPFRKRRGPRRLSLDYMPLSNFMLCRDVKSEVIYICHSSRESSEREI